VELCLPLYQGVLDLDLRGASLANLASLAILAVVDRSGELAVFVTLRFVPASASFRTSTMYRQTYRQSLRQAMRLWQLCASHAPFVMLICIIFDENAAHENNRHH